MREQLIERFGKPLSSDQRFVHWEALTAQIDENQTKIFIVGMVYTIDNGFQRQVQRSAYLPPSKTEKATTFQDLESLLDDLQARITPKKTRRTRKK